MTPRALDEAAVQAKLADLDRLVRQLERRRAATADELERDDTLRSAVLWELTQVVTIAAGASSHIASSVGGHAPASYRESFELAADAAAFDGSLLPALRVACGMRNVLTHEYGDIDLARVAASIGRACDLFSSFTRQVASFLASPRTPTTRRRPPAPP